MQEEAVTEREREKTVCFEATQSIPSRGYGPEGGDLRKGGGTVRQCVKEDPPKGKALNILDNGKHRRRDNKAQKARRKNQSERSATSPC